MRGPSRRSGLLRDHQNGQVLVVFVFGLVMMLAVSTLVFDAGHALVRRRQLQDAGDAAALAAANVIQSGSPRGCSATAGPPPGSPRAAVVTAAQAAVTAALPGFDTSKIVVKCPGGWAGNYAVEVDLSSNTPVYFGGAVGLNGFKVATTSQAVNGNVGGLTFSVVELDPSNLGWPNGTRGCPSVLLSGGPTVVLDGAMQVNSACPAENGGALATNGNAASLSMSTGEAIYLVGGYSPGPLTISPAPLTGQNKVKDPLASGLLATTPPLTGTACTNPGPGCWVQSKNQMTLSGGTTVLYPGVYVGGIQMKNKAVALLTPGIYVMDGGGFAAGAQNAVYSVSADKTTGIPDSTWATTACPDTSCGVLIYNTYDRSSGSSTLGQLSVGAGATLQLKPYLPSADPNKGLLVNPDGLANILLWQDANPTPSSSYQQPPVQLGGGGTVDIRGTVYAPSALVYMNGGSGGSGGSQTNLTLQFISWDLTLSGNASFHFYYQSDDFAKPSDYGLIK